MIILVIESDAVCGSSDVLAKVYDDVGVLSSRNWLRAESTEVGVSGSSNRSMLESLVVAMDIAIGP